MELTFSKMTVDTNLAQEYVKRNKALSELYDDYEGNVKKSPSRYEGVFVESSNSNDRDKIQNIMWNLAINLKQSSELIVQLEYHFRKIPVEDTKAQLNVLIQYINSYPAWTDKFLSCIEDFLFRDHLLVLTHVVLMMVRNDKITVYTSTKEPVAICHLFVTLCREAGYQTIQLDCRNDGFTTNREDIKHGTVAVVSEDADVDSAVDKFLSSAKQVPWYLRRILVQESVYKQFKDALNWKCSLKQNVKNPVPPSALCSQVLTYEGRTFFVDPVEVVEEEQSFITVEAYRTTKEMISMLQQDNPHYLSLWINGIEQINEVTQSTNSAAVWVNNIGDIRGPPTVAKALYPSSPNINKEYYYRRFDSKNDKIVKLVKLSQSWSKLDIERRRDILINVLGKYISSDPQNNDFNGVRNSLMNFTNESFVQAGKDYTCTGVWKPVGFIPISKPLLSLSLAVHLILQGNALVLYGLSGPAEAPYVELFEAAGVPVVIAQCSSTGKFQAKIYLSGGETQTLRVIWTNSGTIFAN